MHLSTLDWLIERKAPGRTQKAALLERRGRAVFGLSDFPEAKVMRS